MAPRLLVALFALASGVAPVLAQRDPPAAPPLGDPAGLARSADRIERHGITWRFDRAHVVGTFANGDPWVLGPVRIAGITPACVETDGRVLHGAMIDPDPSRMLQGYDSALFGEEKRVRYRAGLNVALGVSSDRPLALGVGHSLVSVVSRRGAAESPSLQTAAVLTCLAEVPAPDAFRPPYVRGDKTVRHRAVDLDFTCLQRCAPVLDAPPIDVIARGFARLWLDHFPEWPVRYSHPLDNMPDYGRDMAALVGSAALALQYDLGNDDKRELFVRLVQVGIDLHAALRGGCRWQGIGGHGSGRKFPILLAGRALHDEAMLAIGFDFAPKPRRGDEGGGLFAEDGQTFYVRETAPGVWNDGHGGYTREHDGLPEWGFSHFDHQEADKAVWDADPYRRCCTANGWVGQTLAARMMGLQVAWNHPAYFDYMDRYMQATHQEGWHRAWFPWHAAMWDAYRSNY
ncbi:MAG: hypothetical protein WAT39_24250 [Planctomycetota bacterium]